MSEYIIIPAGMSEFVTIPAARLKELEELEAMHKQMEEDGKAVDKWIQEDLKKMKSRKEVRESEQSANSTNRRY